MCEQDTQKKEINLTCTHTYTDQLPDKLHFTRARACDPHTRVQTSHIRFQYSDPQQSSAIQTSVERGLYAIVYMIWLTHTQWRRETCPVQVQPLFMKNAKNVNRLLGTSTCSAVKYTDLWRWINYKRAAALWCVCMQVWTGTRSCKPSAYNIKLSDSRATTPTHRNAPHTFTFSHTFCVIIKQHAERWRRRRRRPPRQAATMHT